MTKKKDPVFRQETVTGIIAQVETRIAARWARNILVEVVGNHGQKIDPKARDYLKTAIAALSDSEPHL